MRRLDPRASPGYPQAQPVPRRRRRQARGTPALARRSRSSYQATCATARRPAPRTAPRRSRSPQRQQLEAKMQIGGESCGYSAPGRKARDYIHREAEGGTILHTVPRTDAVSERIDLRCKVLEARGLVIEGELHRARGPVSLLRDDDFGDVVRDEIRLLHAVIVLTMQKHDDVGILLDRAGFAKIAHSRAMPVAAFRLS